jgi:hypothetical protein
VPRSTPRPAYGSGRRDDRRADPAI